MESEGLESVCERLRQEVAAELVSDPGKRWRCPAGLKSRIVSYARVCREGGEPLGDISGRLGLVESTLARWLRADGKELAAGFRPVSIVAAEERHQGEIIGATDYNLTIAATVARHHENSEAPQKAWLAAGRAPVPAGTQPLVM